MTERCDFCPWPAARVTGAGDTICESHGRLLDEELERRAEANDLRRKDLRDSDLAWVRAHPRRYRRDSDAWKQNGPPPAKRGERVTPTGERLRLVQADV